MKQFRDAECGVRNGPALTLVLALALGILLTPLAADAQQAGKVYRLGFLSGGSVATGPSALAAVVGGLRDLGYREGHNLIVHERYADGKFERLPALATELVQLPVDVIATSTTPAALAAKRAASTIPIVMVSSGDPVGSGVVDSLARPGGNVTGLSFLGTELAVKQMEILKEIAPSAVRLGFLSSRAFQPEVLFFQEMERAAPTLGVTVRFVETTTTPNYPATFAVMARERVGGLVVAAGQINFNWKQIVELAAKNRLPAIYAWREQVQAGGLVSYGINRIEFFGRAALFVDKILKGAKPADLPVEQPTKFELVINLKTAKALGLTIPQSVLIRADEVIQ